MQLGKLEIALIILIALAVLAWLYLAFGWRYQWWEPASRQRATAGIAVPISAPW
jgi:hypothetical protein